MTRMRIDLSRVAEAILRGTVSPKEANNILQGLGAASYAHWVKLAQEKLRSSSRDYVMSLQMITHPKRVEVVLTGRVPNMIENGWDGGDMRQWMLESPKARQAADGTRYLAVPFRHGTPNTSGRNVGNEMPPEIYRAAKKLVPTISQQHGGGATTRWGGQLNPWNRGLKQDTRDTLNKLKRPWHTTSIYTGMYKRVTRYPSGARSTAYQTFRTISSRPPEDPRSWFHPGIEPRRFAPQVTQELASLLSRAVWKAINDRDA